MKEREKKKWEIERERDDNYERNTFLHQKYYFYASSSSTHNKEKFEPKYTELNKRLINIKEKVY